MDLGIRASHGPCIVPKRTWYKTGIVIAQLVIAVESRNLKLEAGGPSLRVLP